VVHVPDYCRFNHLTNSEVLFMNAQQILYLFAHIFRCQFLKCYLHQVVRTQETSEETHKALLEFGRAMGKTTVDAKVCQNNNNIYLIYVT